MAQYIPWGELTNIPTSGTAKSWSRRLLRIMIINWYVVEHLFDHKLSHVAIQQTKLYNSVETQPTINQPNAYGYPH